MNKELTNKAKAVLEQAFEESKEYDVNAGRIGVFYNKQNSEYSSALITQGTLSLDENGIEDEVFSIETRIHDIDPEYTIDKYEFRDQYLDKLILNTKSYIDK